MGGRVFEPMGYEGEAVNMICQSWHKHLSKLSNVFVKVITCISWVGGWVSGQKSRCGVEGEAANIQSS